MTEAEYEELSRQADEAVSGRDNQTARELLGRGLADARQHGDSSFEAFFQAEMCVLNEDYVAALSHYDKVLSARADVPLFLRSRGVVLGKLGKGQDAIEWFDKALAVNPNDYDSLRGKGVALFNLGKYQEAIEWFDKALAIQPNDYRSVRNKGIALGNVGKGQEAIEWFDKALALNLSDYRSLREKGSALRNLGKYKEAIECFDNALAINARDARALRGKAFALHAVGNSKAALRAIKASLELDPDNSVARSLQAFLESPGSLGAEADQEARRREGEERQKEIERAKLEAWEALTARSAHRIGNLTFGMRGALRELSFAELPAEAQREVKSISECVERTETILEEFKRFVAPLTLNAQPCDPCDVMHRAARRVGDELKTVRLECDLPPGGTAIVADVQLIGEAVEELLINATRALKGRGTIRLAVRNATELPAQLLAGRSERQYVVLSVEDDGPGIKPEVADRIFQPFFSTTAGGTGLGLSIVRKTVEAHGGVVREVGTYGKGARFEIFLPTKGGDSDVQGSDSGR